MKCLFLCPNLRALSGPTVNDRLELRSLAEKDSRLGGRYMEGRDTRRGEIPGAPLRGAWRVFPVGEYFPAAVSGFRTSDPG